jgi:hypothetical protein
MCPYYSGIIRHYRITELGVEVVVVVADEAVDERMIIALTLRCWGFQFQRLSSSRASVEERASKNARENAECEE